MSLGLYTRGYFLEIIFWGLTDRRAMGSFLKVIFCYFLKVIFWVLFCGGLLTYAELLQNGGAEQEQFHRREGFAEAFAFACQRKK